jgi:probable phosphoglycerate mutase
MPTIYIIRHAEKQRGDFYNLRLRHQDPPISQKGREDSRKLWSYLCDKEISALYVSSYRRTAQTVGQACSPTTLLVRLQA